MFTHFFWNDSSNEVIRHFVTIRFVLDNMYANSDVPVITLYWLILSASEFFSLAYILIFTIANYC